MDSAHTFALFTRTDEPSYAIVCPPNLVNNSVVQNLSTSLSNLIHKDLNKWPKRISFDTISEFNSYTYNVSKGVFNSNIILGLAFEEGISSTYYPVTLLYNDSTTSSDEAFIQYYRTIGLSLGMEALNVSFVELKSMVIQIIGAMIPFYLIIGYFGLFSVVSTITTDDCKSAKRPYLVICGVKISSYWISSFIFDYIIWAIISTVLWLIYYLIGAETIRENIGLTLFSIYVSGISILLLLYCLSFMFTKPEVASTIGSLVMILLLFLSLMLEVFVTDKNGRKILSYVFALIPITNFYKTYSLTLELQYNTQTFKQLWTSYEDSKILLSFSLANIVIYGFVLFLIEYLRVKIPQLKTRSDYMKHKDFFSRVQQSQVTTEEAINAANQALNAQPGEYAVRVCNVSKLFYNSNGNVIPAVNNVSFGIRNGSIFGFLGTNGAGKTTLMKMITNEISVSNGFIEVDGIDINSPNHSRISICPQFNDHLTNLTTVTEEMNFYAQIFGLTPREAKIETDMLIQQLELTDHRNKTMQQLSGGNARKVAVAIALMSHSNVVLLDEPTSSLDPIARHHVHDLLNRYRGQKTIMICTHLLEEAESLCDTISIMFHGCIYVIETPQYLSNKFGTEWKVDVLLDQENSTINENVERFFSENLPSAKLSISRNRNRVYSIPTNDIKIDKLFKLMKNAVERNIGIKYFTCSSSSLEKVFLELVIKSDEAHRRIVNEEGNGMNKSLL
ncbi:ABC transporter family protein [Histomonas meleagridis]|uniref:ABC transporter family protein n=1 Tax=Histomonas meleagridis TaxID=135588 RepID=UPI00355AC0DD|nr:ABC transporter family protein [Histomonas meleagridis]KAH0800873.1 ABC transporter family protein [Histomonas meleagridis]